MHEDKILFFDAYWKRKKPLFMHIELSFESEIFCINISIKSSNFAKFHWGIFSCYDSVIKIFHIEIFMIADNAPRIRSISYEFYYLKGFWSLIDEVSDEIEIINIFKLYSFTKSLEFIIAPMYITNEESSWGHSYFFGNQGINTLVFFLYSSQFGLPA